MEKVGQPQNDMFDHPTTASQQFNKDDYMHLWQYFSDRADMLKDRLWTIATWLLGFNSAILSFIFGSQLITFDIPGSTIRAPVFVLALALVGCVLCLYAFFLINDYGEHIKRNWDRANMLMEELPLVRKILRGNARAEPEREGDEGLRPRKTARYLKKKLLHKFNRTAELPEIAQDLLIFTLGYLILFLVIAASALIYVVASIATTLPIL